MLEALDSLDRPHYAPYEDLDDQDPFYSLLRNSPKLPRTVNNAQNTRIWYKSRNHLVWSNPNNIAEIPRLDDGILLIEEINNPTISELKYKFHDDLDLGFIHRHVVRIVAPLDGLNATPACTYERLGPVSESSRGLQFDGYSSPVFLDALNEAPACTYDRLGPASDTTRGVHFDGFCSPVFADALDRRSVQPEAKTKIAMSFATIDSPRGSEEYRTEMFVSDGREWHKASTRISCYALGSELYLVLVDVPLSIPAHLYTKFDLQHEQILGSSIIPVLPRDPSDMSGMPWDFHPRYTLQRAFTNFAIRDVLNFMSGKTTQVTRTSSVFHCLLTVSEWHSLLENLECKLRRLQSWATNELDKSTLTGLGAFRHILASLRELIASTETQMLRLVRVGEERSQLSHDVPWNSATLSNTRQEVLHEQTLWSIPRRESPTHLSSVEDSVESPVARTDTGGIDAATLLDKLAKLEDRLGVITKTLNDEIQLFIASVSVRDSEVMLADSRMMREDSQIMKQQAARTTLLTTLAVIYLPLQLITGIFGMNIKEITDGKPRWWACFAALGAAIFVTVVVYLGVKWWQWRASRKEVRDE